MWNDVVGKIFERGSFAKTNRSFEDRGFLRGSINSRGRGRGEANVRSSFLHNFSDEMIAAEHSSCWVQEHQIRHAIRQGNRSKRLQRQGKTRLGEDRVRAAPRKAQAQESVAPDARRILPIVPPAIQRAGTGGSIR